MITKPLLITPNETEVRYLAFRHHISLSERTTQAEFFPTNGCGGGSSIISPALLIPSAQTPSDNTVFLRHCHDSPSWLLIPSAIPSALTTSAPECILRCHS